MASLQYRALELACASRKLGFRAKVYENTRPIDYDNAVTSDNRLQGRIQDSMLGGRNIENIKYFHASAEGARPC